LIFQLRVGINAEPLLQQHAFEQQQGRIGTCAFATGANAVMVYKNGTKP
jgi:hypothetical protein